MIIDKEEKTIYNEAIGLLKQQETLLFQRFNYFLVGNSFLTIAFISMANISIQHSNDDYYSKLNILTIILGISGLIISWLFGAINIHNAKILTKIYLYMRNYEKELDYKKQYIHELPYTFVHNMISNDRELKTNIKVITWNPIRELFRLKNRLLGQHTWGIPILFFIIWTSLLLCYLFY